MVKEQFPPEIEEKRKLLYAEAKQARQNSNNKVRLVRDKLYVNGKQIMPEVNTAVKSTGPTRWRNDQRSQQKSNKNHLEPTTQDKYQGYAGRPNSQRANQKFQNTTQVVHNRNQRQPKPTMFQRQLQTENQSNGQTASRPYEPTKRAQSTTNEDDSIFVTPSRNQSTQDFNIPTKNKFPPWFNIDEQTQNVTDRQPTPAGKTKPTSPLDSDYSSKRQREYTSDSDKLVDMECESACANGPVNSSETVNVTHL